MNREAEVDRRHINRFVKRQKLNTHPNRETGNKDIERLEMHSRQANLKFIALHQLDPRHNRTDVDEIVNTLNYFSSNTTWRNIDIEKVHSLGRAPKCSTASSGDATSVNDHDH